jgi:DNA-binding MarR family transcriptional regulator
MMVSDASTGAGIPPQVARAASDLRAVVGRLRRRLRQPDAADEITPSQMSVLKRLETDGPMTPGALAAADQVRPQSMSTILADLQVQGLVIRQADPNDGRRALIALAPAGKQALQGARRLREERLGRAIAEHLTPEEQQTLIAALALLERLADVL